MKLLILSLFFTLSSCNNEPHPDLEDGVYAEFVTDKGTIICQLEFEKTPMTVGSFVSLAEGTNQSVSDDLKGKPYFNGLKFHRVMANFMIQGGDPTGTGSGSPGYKFPDEFHPDLKHNGAGILSMANSGPGTNGSQFFITHNATSHLDNKHSVFGHVVKGQEVVNAIAKNDVMNQVNIIRKGKAAKNFDAYKTFKTLSDKLMAEVKAEAARKAKELEKKLAGLTKGYTKTASGLYYKITQSNSSGRSPVLGETIHAHYNGTFLDGKKFDSSYDRGQPYPFVIGKRKVIAGWDEGFMLLKEGEKATFIIPPHLAYGQRGYPGAIPPNSTLMFDLELVKIGN